MCTDHTSHSIWLIKPSENLVNVSNAKTISARERVLIKVDITITSVPERKACDPRMPCAITTHPIGWKSKEKEVGGRGWAQTHIHTAGHLSSAEIEANPASKHTSGRRQCWTIEKRKPHRHHLG